MKLIAVLMAILIILEPVGVPLENSGITAHPHKLISEAVSAGKIQKKRTDAAEPEKESEVIMTQAENPEPENARTVDVVIEPELVQSAEQAIITPVHEHTWIPVTETVHHDPVYQVVHHEVQTENVWVEDKPAYDETYENTYLVGMHDICKGCGMDITASGMSEEEYDAHDRQHILNGEDSSYYSQAIFETRIETIHHEAEGHYEDIVVQEAYDEIVLISEAWDEEVITGYICEECGEVQ